MTLSRRPSYLMNITRQTPVTSLFSVRSPPRLFLFATGLFYFPAKALKWHPDKNRDDPKKAEERFKVVSEAYEVCTAIVMVCSTRNARAPKNLPTLLVGGGLRGLALCTTYHARDAAPLLSFLSLSLGLAGSPHDPI